MTIALFCTSLVFQNIGYSVIAPFFPAKFEEKGVNEQSVGVVFSIYSAMWLVASPLTGKLMSEFSRRRILQVKSLALFLFL